MHLLDEYIAKVIILTIYGVLYPHPYTTQGKTGIEDWTICHAETWPALSH